MPQVSATAMPATIQAQWARPNSTPTIPLPRRSAGRVEAGA